MTRCHLLALHHYPQVPVAMDDDDEFLYGSSALPTALTSFAPQPISVQEEQVLTNGLVAHLEEEARTELQETPVLESGNEDEESEGQQEPQEPEPEQEEEEEEEEESEEDDIEIVIEAPARSLDFRQNRPITTRVPSANVPTQPRAQALQAALTTEYTPIARGAPAPSPHSAAASATAQPSTPSQPQPQPQSPTQHTFQTSPQQPQPAADNLPPVDDGIDPSTLPPVKAPPSHPTIDPTEVGIYDGQSILEMDLNALADKPWRRPGSDISDWFNYGFDEISWEAYCYRRRELGELAHVLKANIINFAAMSEDQITALPAEMRGMVITSASNIMNQASQGMMVPGVMDMSGMVGPMGMGMNPGDMSMMPGMLQQDAMQGQQNMGMMQGAQVDQQQQVGSGVGMMQDGFGNQNAGAGMMNMAMGDYGMQDQNQMGQQLYQGMDTSQGVVPVQGSGRGTGYRGAPRGGGTSLRSRGFSGRGRGGRGYDAPPPAPARPASPLPPNVPTGPRNQNKYKDRDGNAPAVDGLDYGGGGGGGRRTPSHEPEERSSSRKRRSSPGLDDIRSSKRR